MALLLLPRYLTPRHLHGTHSVAKERALGELMGTGGGAKGTFGRKKRKKLLQRLAAGIDEVFVPRA